MANISLRTSSILLNSLPKRYASAAAAATPKEAKRSNAAAKEPVRVSKTDNGIVCASLENQSPVTRLAAVFRVGSRDESTDELGVTHALRVFAPLATRNYTVFGVSRNLDQIGAQLSVTSTRETITYLLECSRPHFQRAADIFGEIISRPQLRHWEIDEARPRLLFDLDVYDEQPETRIGDLIHKASFRDGLRNSLYAPRYNAGQIDSELIQNFRNKHFTNDRVSLVGVGIRHDDILRSADLIRLSASAGNVSRQKSQFTPSEIREENNSSLVHAAIGFEGVSLSAKELIASGIVSHAFGESPIRVKYSRGSSKLAKAVLSQTSDLVTVGTFNTNYSDTGLFGFHLVGDKNDIGKAVRAAFGELQKSAKNGLTNEEINRAKNSLKAALSFYLEPTNHLIEALALRPDQGNSLASVNDTIDGLFKGIDAVSANDVNAYLKRLASSRASLAAIGDLSQLPRLEDLKA